MFLFAKDLHSLNDTYIEYQYKVEYLFHDAIRLKLFENINNFRNFKQLFKGIPIILK